MSKIVIDILKEGKVKQTKEALEAKLNRVPDNYRRIMKQEANQREEKRLAGTLPKNGKLSKAQTRAAKQRLVSSMVKTLGIVTSACKMAGLSRKRYYDWLEEDEQFASAINDVNNIALDFVETALFEQIRSGLVAPTIFYLKTKGKARGYVERIDHNHTDRKQIRVELEDGGIPEWLDVPDAVEIPEKLTKKQE